MMTILYTLLIICSLCHLITGDPAPVPHPAPAPVPVPVPKAEPRSKYGNLDYDKDMLESVLKEVLGDEITRLKPGAGRGVSDEDRSDRMDTRKSSIIGMDDYLDRLLPERSEGRPSDHRSSHSDEYVDKVRGSSGGHRDKFSESQSDPQYENPHQQQQQQHNSQRDLEQEVAMLEEKLRMEKSMRQKLEQQEARLREQRRLQQQSHEQESKLREERKRIQQLLEEEKSSNSQRQRNNDRHKINMRHKEKMLEQQEELALADVSLNDATGDSTDLDRLNLKSYSSALAAAAAAATDPDLKALDPDDLTSLKSLSSSSKFFASHPELLDTDSLTSSLSLRPSSTPHLTSSSLESALRSSPSFNSLSPLIGKPPIHHHPQHRPHHPHHPPPPHGPHYGHQMPGYHHPHHGHHPNPSSFSSPTHAASSYSPSYAPKYQPPPHHPPPHHGPHHGPHYMPPMMRRPPPIPGAGPVPGFPVGHRPFGPGMGGYHPFGAASSLSHARFPPHGPPHPLSPPPMGSLHSIAASMYPNLYAGLNQRSSSPSPASAQSSPSSGGTADSEKKDPKGKKLKSMLMDFAVSSILDVGMMNLMGNILGKINPESNSSA